ncbi:MAG: MoaD/ThiS family protein [Pseudomonadota bacterium]
MAKILYFSILVDKFGRAEEQVSLPGSVTDVRTLLAWLRTRGGAWEKSLGEDAVKVTLNRQFAEAGSAVNDKMEIAIVPARLG